MGTDERSAVCYKVDVPRVFNLGRGVDFEYDALYLLPRPERDLHHVARGHVEMVRD